MVIHLVFRFVAGNTYFLSVDHDDVIASIHVRRVLGLMLSAQARGDLGGHTTKGFSFCVDYVPVALD